MQVPRRGEKLHSIARPNSPTGDDSHRIPRTTIGTARECSQAVQPIGEGNLLHRPSTRTTAEDLAHPHLAQLIECLIAILEQVEGAMEPDLQLESSRTFAEDFHGLEIHLPAPRARSDHNPLEAESSREFHLLNRTLQAGLIHQEVPRLGA